MVKECPRMAICTHNTQSLLVTLDYARLMQIVLIHFEDFSKEDYPPSAQAKILSLLPTSAIRSQHSLHVLTGSVLQRQQQHYKTTQTSCPNWAATFGFGVGKSF